MFRLFLAAVLGSIVFGKANALEPRVFEAVTLPKPPTIDGVVDLNEWAGAITGTGLTDIVSQGPGPENLQFWLAMD